ncbi:MAG TPA: RimK family alpha-L-glutamate ligase [Longimicrobiales bacterium]|nr:RimK family alpha-L-glutamate ligase [Longimicrobiales bacterium]
MRTAAIGPAEVRTGSRVSVGLVCTGVRPEEKMLVDAFSARGVELHVVDDRLLRGDLAAWPDGMPEVDAALLRSKSHWRNAALARWLEGLGVTVVNARSVIETCGDKISTTLALLRAGVPTLTASVSFTPEGGRLAGEAVGFPLVVKPVIGSWGRLIGKVNDADGLEAVLDHKASMGGAPHAVTYLQRFVEKKGKDIRSFVVDGRCIAAIERTSGHWKTNTALGASASARIVDAELAGVSEGAAAAVGGGAVAVDIFETDEGYLVNEVNGTMEFRNSVHTTGVDIPGLVADHVIDRASARRTPDRAHAPADAEGWVA